MSNIVGKKRFWFLNLVVILCIAFCFFYIAIMGTRYEVRTSIYYDERTDIETDVVFSQEGVAEYTGSHLEDNELIVSFKSLKKGSTDVSITVRSDEDGSPEYQTKLYVNTLGTIFEHNELKFSFSGYKVVITMIILVLAYIVGVMVYTFADMQKKAKFCYPMIAAGGIALFDAILILFLVYKMMNNMMTSFSMFLSLVSETGQQFLLAMTPFMIVLAVSLTISNFWLLRNEGYRPVNALGIAFSIIWIIGMGVSFGFMFTDVLHIENYELANDLNKGFTYMCCYFECMLLSTIVCAYSASRHTPPYDRDCIIILGCAIRKDGTPTPLLRMRADSALRFERAQHEKSGKHAIFVPSGGQGSDEIISEAESMRRYLNDQGVGDDQIVKEDKSTSTEENMRFSKAVIEGRMGDIAQKKIAFATTNYHVFRGYILAQKNGFDAQGISAKTKWYFFPNAFLREFVGLLVDKKLWHIVHSLLFIAVFIGIGRII